MKNKHRGKDEKKKNPKSFSSSGSMGSQGEDI